MRSSAVLASCFAALALATPIRHLHAHEKKAIVYDVVTDIVVVTVTEDPVPTTTSEPPAVVVVSKTVWVQANEAAPTTSSSEPPVVIVTTTVDPAPAPAPTTSEAPTVVVVTVEPSSEAPAAPSTTVVVQAAAATSVAATVATAAASDSVAITTWEPTNSIALQIASDKAATVNNHGTARSQHSASGMAWNQSLADSAAVLAGSCKWGHSMNINGGGYGQNLAAQGSSLSDAWTAATALENAIISEWYSEQSIYSRLGAYGKSDPPSTSEDYLHFTQVVWKSSTSVGCAVAKCNTNNSLFPNMYMWYTVCNYFPAGNVAGAYASNVASS